VWQTDLGAESYEGGIDSGADLVQACVDQAKEFHHFRVGSLLAYSQSYNAVPIFQTVLHLQRNRAALLPSN
jgi:hypothetical protein